MGRFYYVTPTSYLELINTFKNLLHRQRRSVLDRKERYVLYTACYQLHTISNLCYKQHLQLHSRSVTLTAALYLTSSSHQATVCTNEYYQVLL
jgi:hypothetical protein